MQKGILDFGVDEETEQILQILHSNRIRDRIIEEFGLEQHYGINPESKYRLVNYIANTKTTSPSEGLSLWQ